MIGVFVESVVLLFLFFVYCVAREAPILKSKAIVFHLQKKIIAQMRCLQTVFVVKDKEQKEDDHHKKKQKTFDK